MKKLIASILCACTISSLLVGCGSTSDQADQAGDTTAETQTDAESEESTESTGDAKTNADADHVINVWAFTDEVPGMIEKYKELHPDFDYDINTTIIQQRMVLISRHWIRHLHQEELMHLIFIVQKQHLY